MINAAFLRQRRCVRSFAIDEGLPITGSSMSNVPIAISGPALSHWIEKEIPHFVTTLWPYGMVF